MTFTTILHLVRDDEFVTIEVEAEAGYDLLGEVSVSQAVRLDTGEVLALDADERWELEESASGALALCS